MFMLPSSLEEFIQPVPLCEQTAALATVLEIFRRGDCARLVVVNEQQCPVGVVNLQTMMPYLLSQNSTKPESDWVAEVAFNMQQPLAQVSLSLIKPLKILPAQLRVAELPYLESPSSDLDVPWAVVDSAGKFLGLVDQLRLWKFLATSKERPEFILWEQSSTVLNSANALISTQNGASTAPLTKQLFSSQMLSCGMLHTHSANKAQNGSFPLEYSANRATGFSKLSQNRAPHRTALCCSTPAVQTAPLPYQTSFLDLQPLIQLLEQLPIPLMLQTGTGQMLTQNLTWCQQVGDYPNSDCWQYVKLPLKLAEFSPSEASHRHETSPRPTPHTCANPNLWLVLAQDITEQQQVAKELAAKNADLVQLNRLKDEFLACISHELKTPLTSVLGLSSLLKDQVLGQLNERQARYAQLIHQSGRQLMTVVNDILDLTRVETGQLELMPEPVYITAVCERAFLQAQQLQSGKDSISSEQENQEQNSYDSRFTLRIEPGLETLVADELRLRQMLTHLLSNALKFTETNGSLGLNVSRWDGWIAFTIWDTGIGIPTEKQHLIFQKFQQLENPLTRRFDGTGLGLVLTQRLAHLHGGDVSFTSKEGKGSHFTLLLPPSPPQQGSAVLSSPPPCLSPSLVLVVEAAPQYIEHSSQQLNRLGYRVVIARSGTEAIEKARRLCPVAILLNPLLPLLSGWDVLTLLKADPQTRNIPVVVTATQAEKQQAYSNRANDFLSLPVQGHALRQSLARLTKHRPYTTNRLTILRLLTESMELNSEVDSGLNCRVLEADDLEQAELLARVWEPNVVLLDGTHLEDPLAYLHQLSSYDYLASLPLVTLDHQTTQAANQVTGLSVFPCLASTESDQTAALLQVIQVAAGMSWRPSILVVDASLQLDESVSSQTLTPEAPLIYPSASSRLEKKPPESPSVSNSEQDTEHPSHSAHGWLQALSQYLRTAGYRSLLPNSWAEVFQQLGHQNVDLLLIHLADTEVHPPLMKALESLTQLSSKPPILVLDHRWHQDQADKLVSDQSQSSSQVETLLRATATQMLQTTPQSMAQLLEQINQALSCS